MIKGILIDLDNTLYDYEKAHTYAMESVYNFAKGIFDIEVFKEKYNIAREQIHTALKNTASSHNRLLYFQRTIELIGHKNFTVARILYKIYWDSFFKEMKLFNGVIEFFEKNKDKKICLLTDLTCYIQYRKIEYLKLNKYINYLVTSEEIGVEKPHKKMFEASLKKMNLKPEEVIMIGDSYEKDIQGAINMNIKPFYKSKEKIENIRTFDSFYKLGEMINE